MGKMFLLLYLQEMESLILHLLKWDLSAIVPNDFLDHVLHRMPISRCEQAAVKRHAQAIAALCAAGKMIYVVLSVFVKLLSGCCSCFYPHKHYQ